MYNEIPRMCQRVGLLSLPVELLQAIAELLDVPTFRLSCKAVNAAVFDVFATHYLNCLECFVLDPRRLQRLNNIISHEQLARKNRRIILSLDPFESTPAADISLACSNKLDKAVGLDAFWLEQNQAREHYIREQYRRHGQQMPDAGTLTRVLRHIRALQSTSLALNFQPHHFNDSSSEEQTAILAQSVQSTFTQVFNTSCKVTELLVDDESFLPPTLRTPAREHTLRTFGQYLECFSATPFLEDVINLLGEAEEEEASSWAPASILAGARAILTLHVDALNKFYHPRGVRTSGVHFTSLILNANSLIALQRLELSRVDLRPTSFMAALTRCSSTVQILLLDDVYLTSDGQHWSKILTLLLSCHRLSDLTLYLLQEQSHRFWAKLLHPYDKRREWKIGLELHGRKEIEDAVVLNIDEGLSFEGLSV